MDEEGDNDWTGKKRNKEKEKRRIVVCTACDRETFILIPRLINHLPKRKQIFIWGGYALGGYSNHLLKNIKLTHKPTF